MPRSIHSAQAAQSLTRGTALRPGPVGSVVILPLAIEQQAQVPDAVPLVPVNRALEQQLQPVLPQPQPVQPQDQPESP